jgi:hypothetical protein
MCMLAVGVHCYHGVVIAHFDIDEYSSALQLNGMPIAVMIAQRSSRL